MASGVRLAAADAAPALAEARMVCAVCARQLSKYGCPRCNMRTCSLECYKAHSPRCTEEFARDNTLEAMKGLKVDDEQRRRMVETLQRFHAQASESGGESGSSSESEDEADEAVGARGGLSDATLARLAEREELRLEDLSPEEQRAFMRAVGSGSLSHLLPAWEPWWLRPDAAAVALRADGTRAVAPLDTDADTEDADGVPAPPREPLPPLRTLLRGSPSPLLFAHAADAVAAYCVTLRVYNGDWGGDAPGAAQLLLALSASLAAAAAPPGQRNSGGDAAAVALPATPHAALAGVAQRAAQPGLLGAGAAPHAGAAAADAARLLGGGRAALLCALAHAQRLLLAAAAAEADASQASTRHGSGARGALLRAERKLFFLQAWANEQSAHALEELRESCEREAQREAMARAQAAQAAGAAVPSAAAATAQQQPSPRVLISELPGCS